MREGSECAGFSQICDDPISDWRIGKGKLRRMANVPESYRQVPVQTLQSAAMQTGDVGNDRQSKAAMTLLAAGRIQAMKRLQGLSPLLNRHSFPLIPDVDAAAILDRMQLEDHRSCAVGEGVVNQVGDCAAEGNGFHRETHRGQLQLQLIRRMAAGHFSQQLIQGNLHEVSLSPPPANSRN